MKKYFYVTVIDRVMNVPQVFDTLEEARSKMRQDFIYYAEKDSRLDEIKEDSGIDLSIHDVYEEFEDCGIAEKSAWVNNTYNHTNWDAHIFEVEV